MRLRAAFMGSPEFAVPSLRAVAEHCDLRLVVCQPDRPAGRGRTMTPPAVKHAAVALGVPCEQPSKMKDGTLAAVLRSHALDLVVVVAFGRILPADLLAIPRLGCINVHASLLPRWRGAAPIQRAILAGDRETGVTIMQMDAGLDTGPIHRMVKTPIDPHETQGDLFARLAELGATALGEFLRALPEVPPASPQPEQGMTLAPPLTKEEGVIDWSRAASELVDHVRGMDPWPSAMTKRGDDELKLFGAKLSAHERPHEAAPGEVLRNDAAGLHIACGRGALAIAELQPAGKRRMTAAAYAAGRPFKSGERLG
ncbi:MAG TPA: methionyl-tRNA formyltransferase [Nannocystaceae bacterium]|nr:methionyl-tRNA formyltransferase [Nannocystaceae bacterium]